MGWAVGLFDTLAARAETGLLLGAKAARDASYASRQRRQRRATERANTATLATPAQRRDGPTMVRLGGQQGAARMADFSSYLAAITIGGVYDAVSTIGYNYATSRLRVLGSDDKDVEGTADTYLALRRLLDKPNGRMSGFKLREHIGQDTQLVGNAICALDAWVDGRPTEMYRLRPDRVRIVQMPDGERWYRYEVRTDGVSEPIWYSGDEILHFAYAHPTDPLWGLGPTEAAETRLSTGRRFAEFKLNYFDRGAILDGILTLPKRMSDDEPSMTADDRREFLDEWRASREANRNKFKTAILAEGMGYTPIQEPLGNIPVVQLSKLTRNEILQAYGVPPQMLGDFEGTNYRNAQEADAMFWGVTMTPLLVRTEDEWSKLTALFDPTWRAEYEKKDTTDDSLRAETAHKMSQSGVYRANEIRKAGGAEPFEDDDPRGDLLVIPSTMALLTKDQAGSGAEVHKRRQPLTEIAEVADAPDAG